MREIFREERPPMLRCWVNRHSGAVLFPGEAHVIIEGTDGRRDFNIVRGRELVLLGESASGDALGCFEDAYVHVGIITEWSDDETYLIQLDGLDSRRMRVSKDQVIFAHLNDPIWNEIRGKLEEENRGNIAQPVADKGDLVIDMTDGSYR